MLTGTESIQKRLIVTGGAGFIGFHTAKRLLDAGCIVLGIDNFSPFYDVRLKQARWSQLESYSNFQGRHLDICNAAELSSAFREFEPDGVVHLAAQPSVSLSLKEPQLYQQVNIGGFLNVLEACRALERRPRLVYASSSSVYGEATLPFSEIYPIDRPQSLYAATKCSNETMAYSYGKLYDIKSVGLRFFTVYGPWGRPDMAYWRLAEALCRGERVVLSEGGRVERDFTWIGDAVETIVRSLKRPKLPTSVVLNVGTQVAESLTTLVELLAESLGVAPSDIESRPLPLGDLVATCANITRAKYYLGYEPRVTLAKGIPQFAKWFRSVQSADWMQR